MFKGSEKRKEPSEKRALLRKLIDMEGEACTNAIIFCNRKSDVDIVSKSLNKYGYNAAPIHGDLDQSHRTKTLDKFRDNELRILVASDVAARGLDIPAVTHVFNFDVPSHAEDYVHRIGRTGRAGRKGTAIMICVARDEKNFADVERLVKEEIPRLENPMGAAPAAPSTDEPPKEDKPKRSRSRRKPDPKPEQVADAAPQPDAPQSDAPQDNKPRNDTPRQEKPRDDKPRDNHRGRGNGRGGHNRRDDNNKVIGLGEDTPAFISMSFAERAKV